MKISPSVPFNHYSPSTRQDKTSRRGDTIPAYPNNSERPASAEAKQSPTESDNHKNRIPAPSKSSDDHIGNNRSHAKAVQAYQQGRLDAEPVKFELNEEFAKDSVQRVNSYLGRNAASLYAEHQSLDEKDQVSQSLGIDTYA